jgi:putative spermidine/putrescine transport system ATP-binding protein
VAQFVGAANVLEGDAARVLCGHANAMLRPERIRLGPAGDARASGTVHEVQYFGAFTRLKVALAAGAATLQVDLPEGPGLVAPAVGETVHLHWDERAVHALAARP